MLQPQQKAMSNKMKSSTTQIIQRHCVFVKKTTQINEKNYKQKRNDLI